MIIVNNSKNFDIIYIVFSVSYGGYIKYVQVNILKIEKDIKFLS